MGSGVRISLAAPLISKTWTAFSLRDVVPDLVARFNQFERF
jgi:hypothetical protein